MEKLTLSGVINELEVSEHNNLVRQLAYNYRAVEAEIARLDDRRDAMNELIDEILEISEQDHIEEEDLDCLRGRVPGTSIVINGGSTSLENWRNVTDNTRIAGGSITANKLTIG